MQVTAAMVKELRDRTGAGMMECKKALSESEGDMEAAIEALRLKGAAKADRKAGRVAAEGRIAASLPADGRSGVLVEVNSETDFVAKNEQFVAFTDALAGAAATHRPADVGALVALRPDGAQGEETFEQRRLDLVQQLGENINVRRLVVLEAAEGARVSGYVHGGRIGVLVEVSGGSPELGRDLAMHIAASAPVCVAPEQVPEQTLERERALFREQARESGKPDAIVEKIVEGRVRKYLNEITLLGQPFVKDPDTPVSGLLEARDATVTRFERLEVGEGIEKQAGDFAAEVMAQATRS